MRGTPTPAAFNAYFDARYHEVRRRAYLLCGDWHHADDLAQTAFIRLASSWHRLRDPGGLDAYLRTCLLRAFLTERRRAWRRRELSTGVLPEPVGEDGAGAATEQLTMIGALARVPPRQRAVLVCRYYDGLDVAQTAEVVGCSQGTVKSQTARGLAALRAALGLPELATSRGECAE